MTDAETMLTNEHVVNGIHRFDGYIWDVLDLVKSSETSPLKTFTISELEDILFSRPWKDKTGNKIRPVDVLEHKAPADHWNRILEADLKFPIIVYLDEGFLCIADGIHRLSKAKMLGHQSIQARYINIWKMPHYPDEK